MPCGPLIVRLWCTDGDLVWVSRQRFSRPGSTPSGILGRMTGNTKVGREVSRFVGYSEALPTAYAVGCILSPLRG